MLNAIRAKGNTLASRIILALLAIAFGFWGIGDILRSRNNFDLVTFKTLENISEEEFLKAKAKEVSRVQQREGISLSEEQIEQYGINKMVLDRLIAERLMAKLVEKYELDVSDKMLAEFIKEAPAFKNKDGEFDLATFKSYLQHSRISETEYSTDLKSRLLREIMISRFIKASYVPKSSVQSIANFLAEEREIDIASIDLTSMKYAKVPDSSDAELEEFYKKYIDLFTLPEKRSISYVVIDQSAVSKNIAVSDAETIKFFNENKEDFGKESFDKAKGKIAATLRAHKIEDALVDLHKKLDDEVAGGSSLKEIAGKFKLKIVSLTYVTTEELVKNKTIGGLVDKIFDMQSGELSYLIELPAPKTVALVEVGDVKLAAPRDFKDVRSVVASEWRASKYFELNMKILEDFVATTKPEDFNASATKSGLVVSKVNLKRADLAQNDKFPPEMLGGIFNTDAGIISGIYPSETRAFVAIVRNAKVNQEAAQSIMKKSSEALVDDIRNSLIHEIMIYLTRDEDVNVNKKDRVLE